jgi:hypothetical protein
VSGWCLGSQLLELVDHDEQAPLRPSGVGQQQFVSQPAQPTLVELMADVAHRPI